MSYWQIPPPVHPRPSGNLFIWNTSGGPGAVDQFKFQIGTTPGGYNIHNGSWRPGGQGPQFSDSVNLPGAGSPTLYVRALYRKSGQTYYTNPFPFTCAP